MIKFSLILPVYNVEKYLAKCIESCLKQDISYAEYEIIIVIDGSPDHSVEIAKHFKQANSNIQIIERENGGLSAARNTGLKHAKGEYVWFIDSDDFIVGNVLTGIYDDLDSNKLDCLWIQWKSVTEHGKELPQFTPYINNYSFDVYSGMEFASKVLNQYLFAWSFIYRREFLIKYNLYFKDKMLYEDTELAYRALPLIGRIRLYNSVCYYYLQREGSIVHSFNDKKLHDILINVKNGWERYNECSQNKKLQSFYAKGYSIFLLALIKEMSLYQCSLQHRQVLCDFIEANGIKKVIVMGNLVTKIIALVYNTLGYSYAFSFTRLLAFMRNFIVHK